MKKYIAILGLSALLGSYAMADHAGIKVEHVDKVIFKKGMSHHEKVMMMKCLLTLKKFKTEEEAMDAALEKIDAKCEKHGMDEKNCKHIKKKVGMAIYHCYTARDFMKEFMAK